MCFEDSAVCHLDYGPAASTCSISYDDVEVCVGVSCEVPVGYAPDPGNCLPLTMTSVGSASASDVTVLSDDSSGCVLCMSK